MDKEMEKELIQAVPLPRRGAPEEVANVYTFLASNEASYVTGALYAVNGGTTIAKKVRSGIWYRKSCAKSQTKM